MRRPQIDLALPAARVQGGFTLLEVLVVLVIVSLMVAMVGPNIIGQLGRATRQFEFDQLREDIGLLSRRVRVDGRAVVLSTLPMASASAPPPSARASSAPLPIAASVLELPPGWTARFEPPLAISADGVCSGSTLMLGYLDENAVPTQVKLTIAPFTCDVDVPAKP